MSPAADGERHAIRGYQWQYDQLAARVYDTLVDETFRSLRLVDPTVGKVDDLVLVTDAGTTGHQYKSEDDPGPLTLGNLLAPRRTRGGQPAPSLMRELADGWTTLREQPGTAEVHLVTNRWASIHDHLGEPDDPHRPSPDNFSAFLTEVVEPIRTGALSPEDVAVGWQPALARIQDNTGLDDDAFAQFLRAMHIRVHQPNPLMTADTRRRSDIIALSDALFRTVAGATHVVTLDREELLAVIGWTDRTRLPSPHEFPVDVDTYAPLDAAIDTLSRMLQSTTSGYLGLVGPPGSGKSTLLAQSLTGTWDRVLRYYAYVPRGGAQKNRLEGSGFLHDLVLMLQRITQRERGHLLDPDVSALRTEFHLLLRHAAAHYAETGQRTIVIVDGLDHVQRDHPAVDNLLGELPNPDSIGDGVVFIVGTRTLGPLRGEITAHLGTDRVVDLGNHRLPYTAVLNICQRAKATSTLGTDVHERIASLAAGHPLSLGYLLNKVAPIDDPTTALTALGAIVAYDGDIAATYQALWDTLEPEHELLAVVTRLRIPFTYSDVVSWFGNPAGRKFKTELAYLFRFSGTAWTTSSPSTSEFRSAPSWRSHQETGTPRRTRPSTSSSPEPSPATSWRYGPTSTRSRPDASSETRNPTHSTPRPEPSRNSPNDSDGSLTPTSSRCAAEDSSPATNRSQTGLASPAHSSGSNANGSGARSSSPAYRCAASATPAMRSSTRGPATESEVLDHSSKRAKPTDFPLASAARSRATRSTTSAGSVAATPGAGRRPGVGGQSR